MLRATTDLYAARPHDLLLVALILGGALSLGCTRPQYGGPNQTPGVAVETSLLSGSNQEKTPEKSHRVAERVRTANPPSRAQPAASHNLREAKSWGRHGSLPDPKPLSQKRQWDYELLYDSGRVTVASVELRVFDKPVVTARRMGRFAIELWRGRELIERVRFDFPLLAADDAPTEGGLPLHHPPNLSLYAKVRRKVLVPDSERPNRAILVDRATGQERELPWPPTPGRTHPSAL